MKYQALFLTAFVSVVCIVPVDARTRVSVLDEKSRLIKDVPFIKLSRNRIGIPASTLRSLGLAVGYDEKARELYISIYGTDATIVLRSGSRRIYSKAIESYDSEVYSYPLALKRHGHFYVSVSAVQSSFPEIFSYKWNQKTRSLLLQPRRDR